MEIRQIWAVWFSPTGGTKALVRAAAQTMGEALGVPVRELDFTPPQARQTTYTFGPDELVVLGTPVYAGRVPNKLRPDLETCFRGSRTPLVPVSVFGNRSFDDGLMELKTVLEERGFVAVGAAGLVSRHVFSATLAAGRPDADDHARLRAFSTRVAKAVAAADGPVSVTVAGNDPVGPYYTPLQADGTPAKFLKATPVTDPALCTRCGLCVRACPMGSIDGDDPARMTGICIKCHACVRGCPAGAKSFQDEQLLSHIKMLEEHYARRADDQFFE